MATELGSAYISVGLGTNKLGPEIKKVFGDAEGVAGSAGEAAGKKFSGKFSGFMKAAAVPALGAVAGIGLLAKGMGDVAATAEQNLGAVETVFGGAAAGVGRFAANSANAVGLSASSYNELSAVTGTALKSAGVSVDELAAKNDALITRGADLASVFGGDTATAVSAMGAAFRGEFDSLEQYGLTLTAEAVNAELAARGQDKLGGAALGAAKKQATMDLIMQQSAGSAGNFAKESDTAAGAQQRSTAAWEDASAKLGEALLPIMTTVATKVSEMSKWVSENAGLVTGLAIGVGILAAAIGVWSVVQGVLNLVMAASPVTWIVLGIIGLIAAIVLLVMNWQQVVDFIGVIWGGFIAWITGVMNGFLSWWDGVWQGFLGFLSDTWANASAGITGFIDGAIQWFTDLPGKILGALGDLGGLLLGAGGQILDGFLKGLTKGFEEVQKFVGGIGEWIAKNKGPKAYDLKLLVPAGGWIMDGLESGIKSSMPSLQRTLGGVSASISTGITGSPYVSATAGVTTGAGGGGARVVQNIHPAPGMSEEAVGNIAANSMNRQLRSLNV